MNQEITDISAATCQHLLKQIKKHTNNKVTKGVSDNYFNFIEIHHDNGNVICAILFLNDKAIITGKVALPITIETNNPNFTQEILKILSNKEITWNHTPPSSSSTSPESPSPSSGASES